MDSKDSTRKSISDIDPLLRVTLIFLLIILSVVILKYGKPLLIPLSIAAILAMMLSPLMDRLLNKGIPKWLAITLLSLLVLVIAAGIFYLLGSQIGIISQDWPQIQQKLLSQLDNIQGFIQKTFRINPGTQEDSAKKALPGLAELVISLIGSVSKVITDGILILIYLILMLAQRRQFKKFILHLVKPTNRTTAGQAISECISTSSRFLFGRLIIVVVLVFIYCIGFWLGKVPYALFLGLIAAILSIIPFLGNVIGGGLACILAFVTGGFSSVLIVMAVIVIGQIIDNYVLTPWMVGNAVRLNPFVTIVSVVAFAMVWGVVGAIMALPLVGMLRILLQNMDATHPYADFLGNEKSKR